MNTRLLKQARSLFNVPDVPAHVRRHNVRAWARSVAFLGDKWLLAAPMQRKGARP
jgi:hypothetical protein